MLRELTDSDIEAFLDQHKNDIGALQRPTVRKAIKSLRITGNDSKDEQKSDSIAKKQFVNDILEQLDYEALVSMCDGVDDIRDFTLMRLLILTMNFMVECESTLKGSIKCINYQPNIQKPKEILLNEMKINGIYQSYLSIQNEVSKYFNSKRNQSMGKHKLTKYEISCIRLWTQEDVCSKIKSSHRKGNSCQYRYFCQQILFGLKKLKYYDVTGTNKLKAIKYIYSGIANVKIDLSKNITTI